MTTRKKNENALTCNGRSSTAEIHMEKTV